MAGKDKDKGGGSHRGERDDSRTGGNGEKPQGGSRGSGDKSNPNPHNGEKK